MTTDMTAVIAPRSDQLNSDDLIAGPRTIRIRDVAIRPGTEQPVSIFYDGDNGKPWKPCKTASRVLVAAWGADANAYRGRAATIYRDAEVTWGGMKVGGIRVAALSDIDKPLVIALTEKKGSKKVATIRPLVAEVTTIGLTIDAARSLIAGATDMDALRRVWSRKDMAPFRTELQSDLDDRKVALEFDASPHANHGEAHTDTDALVRLYAAATSMVDVVDVEAKQAAMTLSDTAASVVTAARADAIERLGRS